MASVAGPMLFSSTSLQEPREKAPGFAVPTRLTKFVSFDRRVSAITFHQRPDRYRDLEVSLGSMPRIARGGGLSYSAASFGEGSVVQDMTAFSRILALDQAKRRVTVEAGARVGDILRWALSRNFYLPVVPGHPLITVGGCIASDVHGKNPWLDGTFRESVRTITLYHPDTGFVTASSEARSELFDATCGGFGLTGVIVSAELQLIPAPASRMRVVNLRAGSFQHATEVLLDDSSPLVYTWHPGRAAGLRFGEGLVLKGDWERTNGDLAAHDQSEALMLRAPRVFPVGLWNPATLAAANSALSLEHWARAERTLSLLETCFPLARRDAYHRLFGPRGFGEIQLLIPISATNAFFKSFHALVEAIEPTIAFASMKRFRGRSSGLGLSGEGILFAVDYMPSSNTARFEMAMDRLLLQSGAQPNVSKHSRITRTIAEQSLPGFNSFRELVHRIDPRRVYQSELSRRLSL